MSFQRNFQMDICLARFYINMACRFVEYQLYMQYSLACQYKQFSRVCLAAKTVGSSAYKQNLFRFSQTKIYKWL